MKHGFIKVAAATPRVTVADCGANLEEALRIARHAQRLGVHLLVFPELSLTGYTCGDLLLTDTLCSAAERALGEFLHQTEELHTISIIGFPLVVNDKLYNSAAICQNGRILGVIPRSFEDAYGGYADSRYFSAYHGDVTEIALCGQSVPFGAKQIFSCRSLPSFSFGVEIGADLYAPVPPSVELCKVGARIVAHPSASPELVTATEYRRSTLIAHTAKTVCGYVSANCGQGESTTDAVFGGHCLIAENGRLLAESRPFHPAEDFLTVTEIDVLRLSGIRRARPYPTSANACDACVTSFDMPVGETSLTRRFSDAPFIPSDAQEKARRCQAVLDIQAHGLAHRMEKAYAKTAVIGISGGLDSCLAILVAARAMDILGRPRTDIIGVTMPCFGTTKRTRSNAECLCTELGTSLRCVNIADSVRLHFRDIGHEESNHNVVYENAQARERTQVLMDIANTENGLVVGTGDLSELALGWATYNGDHMSMYGVNASLPKTLIRHVVAYCADEADSAGKAALADVLRSILDTPISPELLPADECGQIAQKTEDLVGPYELHDFYLYYMIGQGYAPDKLYRIAKLVFAGRYDDAVLLHWLKNFIRRFFAQQFKRSCLPDGPKVGKISFSPRGDWKMPSDATAKEWMRIADTL